MPQLLKVGLIDAVGFVENGASPAAHVVFWKAAPPPQPKEQPMRDRQSVMEKIVQAVKDAFNGEDTMENGTENFDPSTLDDAGQAYVTALTEARDQAVEKESELAARVTALEKELADAKAGGTAKSDPEPDEVLKGAEPAVRAVIEKMQESLDKAEKKAAEAIEKADAEKARREEAEIRKRFEKGGDLAFLPGESGTHVEMLKAAAGLPDDVQKQLDELLTTASEQIRQSKLFSAFGKDGEVVPGGDAYEKLEAVAQKIQKDEGVDIHKARALANDRNPDLVREYDRERRSGI